MKQTYTFSPAPIVCSRQITVTLDGDVIDAVEFFGGCPGNLAGIARLAKGRSVVEVVSLLEGIRCGAKPTSCPDQLAAGLKEILKKFQATA